MSMIVVTENGAFWSFADLCRNEHLQLVPSNASGLNQTTERPRSTRGGGAIVHLCRRCGDVMVHLNRIGWRVSFLPLCDVSKKADHYVDSRHNTRAAFVGLGQLLGVLLAILRGPRHLG